MRFAPVSKLVIVAMTCVLLAGCGQAGSTQPYTDAKIHIGENVEKQIVVAAPEMTTAPKASQSSELAPLPNLALPGEVAKQSGSSKSQLCEGVADEIAHHFDGLMKCDQLHKVIISLPKAEQGSVKQLLVAMMAWKNEHCIAPAPSGKELIYPVKPDGPTPEAVPLPYDTSKQQANPDPAVYERRYVPCTIDSAANAATK